MYKKSSTLENVAVRRADVYYHLHCTIDLKSAIDKPGQNVAHFESALFLQSSPSCYYSTIMGGSDDLSNEFPSHEEVLNVNVGVLGHVDSGKTSLVKTLSTLLSTAALDKSRQSRLRGMTLDLGFSAFIQDLPSHLEEAFPQKNKLQITYVCMFVCTYIFDSMLLILSNSCRIIFSKYSHCRHQPFETDLWIVQGTRASSERLLAGLRSSTWFCWLSTRSRVGKRKLLSA